MKNNRLQIIIFTLAMLYSSTVHSADLNELYQSDNDKFWSQYWTLQEKAISCTNHDVTAKFLTNAIVMLGNAEVSQANAESIEKLILKNTVCLLESVQKLNSEEKTKIIKFFIMTPIFKDEVEIKKALEKHWGKYGNIKDLYDKLKASS